MYKRTIAVHGVGCGVLLGKTAPPVCTASADPGKHLKNSRNVKYAEPIPIPIPIPIAFFAILKIEGAIIL